MSVNIKTGLYAHGAIMAALITRSKTGKGQKIDCNLFSTQIASLINIGSNYLNSGVEAKKWGTATESIVPYESFPVKDGYFTIGVGSDEHFKDFCDRIGHPELSNDEKYITNSNRVQNREELVCFLKKKFKTKTKKQMLKTFEGAGFPFAPVNSLKETFDDPHIKEIGLVKIVNHPIAGEIKVVGPPVKFSNSINEIRSPPPTLGQHTEEILRDVLGYNTKEILNLKNANIIQ